MKSSLLHTPIAYLKGVGPKISDLLGNALQIYTFEDLLYCVPNRYIDKSKYYTIAELQGQDTEVQIIGMITSIKEIGHGKATRLTAQFKDSTGIIELVWFKGIKFIKTSIQLNKKIVIYGKISLFNGQYSMVHPEIEQWDKHQINNHNGLIAVYPSSEKLTRHNIGQKHFRTYIQNLFDIIEQDNAIQNTLTDNICTAFGVMNKKEALKSLHFPNSLSTLQKAQYSLKFEELFFLQLALIMRKRTLKHQYKSFPFENIGTYFTTFYQEFLPFSLTNAQKKVLKEIRKDVANEQQMNRLLQGDVGSGKTIVAFMSALIALDNQYQVALIAPTEILASQHFQAFKQLANPLGIEIALLTGSIKKKERTLLHEKLQAGTTQILVGTHALFEDTVLFKNLGLVIIDEQHRFGVAQRAKMYRKNTLAPHVLVMTATPIPRTLAMSLYGDLDISIIDELPAGRKPIKTVVRTEANRLAVFGFIKEEIQKKRQVYIVYPLINESEKLDLNDLMMGYESVQRYFPLPQYAISIVHGKMSPNDKAFEMERFVRGETQIMVATTVIEVGVNVPNASVMIIENAERFGLSQLHQLRGRVGRGAEQSYCILMTKDKRSPDAQLRLETMAKSNDGFEIAEVDLQLRGPGDIMGTQQSGTLQLKIADLVKDGPIVPYARRAVEKVLSSDPQLEKDENTSIKNELITRQKDRLKWSRIS